MSKTNSWYVITGGPSTGKSTLIKYLGRQGFKVVPEAARIYIEESLAKGISVGELRADEKQFQDEVLRMKITAEKDLDRSTVTFLDRGMQDTLAYLQINDFALEPWVNEAMAAARYRQVFLLAPLATFTKDDVRTEDAEFTARMHGLLLKAYRDCGMEPLVVPPVSIPRRVAFILEHMKTELAA